MRINLQIFGILKDLLPNPQPAIDLPEGTTVSALLQLFEGSASNPSEVWNVLAVAVNREYSGRDRVLRDGDEVALLPPVSGGRA